LNHAVHVSGDITTPELPQKMIDTALDAFERCDIVFNNAGILTSGSIEEIQIEDVCKMVRINVEADLVSVLTPSYF